MRATKFPRKSNRSFLEKGRDIKPIPFSLYLVYAVGLANHKKKITTYREVQILYFLSFFILVTVHLILRNRKWKGKKNSTPQIDMKHCKVC